jgi:1,2-dihydroxy-3-keto-5-methylthiopentene dioxygenase
MAIVRVSATAAVHRPDAAVAEFLRPYGIVFERWPVEERVSPDASADDILRAYAPEIDALKRRGGYVTADVINVTPDTPNLDALLNKFNKEHRHSEDEVRFIVKGNGVFHIRGDDDAVFSIEVSGGDMITVPAGTRHWFDLCGDRTIRAIRLFLDMSGWTPQYVADGVHEAYPPVCLGPQFIPAEPPALTGTVRR